MTKRPTLSSAKDGVAASLGSLQAMSRPSDKGVAPAQTTRHALFSINNMEKEKTQLFIR
eukprot:m.38058 g.38058  ORF g.38058 m.38058 type:complete len:59 (-) comp10180_c0_seq1:17-193(-)